MQKHVKIYIDYYSFGEQDTILCEVSGCPRYGTDVHHLIFRSQGGKNNIENLTCLCHEHHNQAHNSKEFNQKLKEQKELEFLI